MNIYVVVEGSSSEMITYTHWIQYRNPKLKPVETVDAAAADNFFIVSGRGYPNYFNVIRDAVENVNNYLVYERLVVAVDSEEYSLKEKVQEMNSFLSKLSCRIPIFTVIQFFCFESWALGNRRIFTNNIRLNELREFRRHYDVRTKDPEGLPAYESKEWNRATFAYRYLKLALNNKHRKLTYTKHNPGPITHKKYYEEIAHRLSDTGHVASFRAFLNAFG